MKCLQSVFALVVFLLCQPAQAHMLDGIPFSGIRSFDDVIEARFPRGNPSAPASGFNGKKLQTNTANVQQGGDFPWLNLLKGAQGWTFNSNQSGRPVTPDLLDSDGYLNVNTGDAASGIYTTMFAPSVQEKPGAIIWDSLGNGSIGSGPSNVTVVAYTVTSVSQTGAVQTVNLGQSPIEMKAGQPILMSGFSSGTWGNFNDAWRVQDINTGCTAPCFRINSGVTFTGTATLTTAKATFTGSSTVANVGLGGLNGSSRYAANINPTIGGANGVQIYAGINSIASTSDYPHSMRVFNINDEAALDAGGEFTSTFLSKMANFGVIRFMPWQYGFNKNITNVSTWNTRKSRSYVFYEGSELRSTFNGGDTTGLSGRTYSVNAPSINSATGAAWSGLADKATVHIHWAQGPQAFSGATFANGNSNITIPGHNYKVGDIIVFSPVGAATIPANAGFGQRYTVTAVGVNTVQLAIFGSPILPNANSTGTIVANAMWRTYQVTNAVSGDTISIPNHIYANGDKVAFFTFSGSIPSNITGSQFYFVCSASAGVSIKISTNVGCTGIIIPNANFTGTIESTGALFLNVGGTGVKQLYPTFIIPFIDNQWPNANVNTGLATVVYDQKLDIWISYGGDVDFGPAGIINEVPYESEIALCAAVGAHCYWVTPYLSATPMTDFMPSLMKLAKVTGPSWMIPRFEPPNELWNNVFPQYGYALVTAAAYGWGADSHNWYGKALSTLGQAAAVVYGGTGNLGVTYEVLGGVQTAYFVTGDQGNALPRFAATKYVADGIVQSPLTGSWGTITFTATPAAVSGGVGNVVSALATAQYFAPNAYVTDSGTQTKASLATAWQGSQFLASSITGGVMTVVTDFTNPFGAALAVGTTVYMPDRTTFTITAMSPTVSCGGIACTGTGNTGTYAVSYAGPAITYQQSYTSGLPASGAPAAMVASSVDTVVNATVTGGTSFHVNSITSGNTIGSSINSNIQIWGGNSGIAFASGITIISGTYPNFTLSNATTNQTANFQVGNTASLTGNAQLALGWATWVNTNFSIKKNFGYEGGYSPDYSGSVAGNLLAYQSKQDAALQAQTTALFDNFRGVGVISYPPGVTGAFPSNFLTTGSYPSGNGWAVLENIYQNPEPPIWTAIKNYNFLLKRDVDPASNDNDPMWLEKAA